MSRIEVFNNNEFGELEILEDGDKYWFPATKCAEVLGYTNPRKAILDHCKGVTIRDSLTDGGKQKINYISEGDLYRLIARSKLEAAQRFEKWVFDEVLPTIRKHGVYATPEALRKFMDDPKSIGDVFYALAAEQEKNKQLAEENRRLAEKATYYDMILQNPDAVPITLIAKDYGLSARRFNCILEELGIQYRLHGTWILYQQFADNGYTHSNVFCTPSGHQTVHTCWTQNGRLFLYKKLKENGLLPTIERKVLEDYGA